MTIYIYDTDGFEDGDFKLIDSFYGESNQECEQWAKDQNYDDSDLFAWSYTKA